MAKKITTVSGVIQRIHVDASGTATYVIFTLVGDKSIYSMMSMVRGYYAQLVLTAPGDQISIDYDVTGVLNKVNNLRSFKNLTLESELKA